MQERKSDYISNLLNTKNRLRGLLPLKAMFKPPLWVAGFKVHHMEIHHSYVTEDAHRLQDRFSTQSCRYNLRSYK
jgi:hypothetical protein